MIRTALALAACLAITHAASAQVYTSDWSTRDAGGIITGAVYSYSLSGTIGQIDGQRPGFGGTFTLAPGFWGGQPRCPADVSGDDQVTLEDFFGFFNCWAAIDPCADIDSSGEVDLTDFFAFLNAFAAGC